MLNIIVFISGRGSNLKAIVNSISENNYQVCVKSVISDNPNAAGLEFAKMKNIPVKVFDFKSFESKANYEQAVVSYLDTLDKDLIVLAGYMRILGSDLLSVSTPMINIHPSLLPSFKGLNAQKQAYDYGVKYTGCTVHYVTAELDGGPIIDQVVVKVSSDDTIDTLNKKILDCEHQLLPEVINRFAIKKDEMEK